MKLFGRINRAVRDGTGLIVEALIDASAIPASFMLKAAKRLANAPIGEMHTTSSGAGAIIGVDVRGKMLWLRARVTNGVAALKASTAVYCGLSVEVEEAVKGWRILEVSLADRPFLEKGGSHAGDYVVLCKIFESPRNVARSNFPSGGKMKTARQAASEETAARFDRGLRQLQGSPETVAKRRAEDAARVTGNVNAPPVGGDEKCLDEVRQLRWLANARAKLPPELYDFENNFLIRRAG